MDVQVRVHEDFDLGGGFALAQGVHDIPLEQLPNYEPEILSGNLSFGLEINQFVALNQQLNEQIFNLYKSDIEIKSSQFKDYMVLVSQVGTAAPTVDIIENTLGAVVWTRNSAGSFTGTCAGAFRTQDKCWFTPKWAHYPEDDYLVKISYLDADTILLETEEALSGTDNLLTIPFPIWIRVSQVVDPPVFSPTDIASLWSMHEADSYSQADGSDITTNWTDLSGNARHLTLNGSPTFETGELNSLPIIRIGANSVDYFTVPDSSALTEGAFFIVLKVTTAVDFPLFTAVAANDFYPYTGDNTIYNTFGTTVRKNNITPGSALTNWHVIHGHSKTSDWELFQNGSSIHATATNTVAFPSTNYQLFAGMKADVAAIYLFSAKLSTDDNTSMLAYILSKWGVG